jgi:hypothetical protein
LEAELLLLPSELELLVLALAEQRQRSRQRTRMHRNELRNLQQYVCVEPDCVQAGGE